MKVIGKLKFVSFENIESWSASFLFGTINKFNRKYKILKISQLLIKNNESVIIEDEKLYKRVTVKINANGVVLRDEEYGKNIGTKRQFVTKEGQMIVSKIDARNGAFGLIPSELDGAIVTNDFPLFDINHHLVNKNYLILLAKTNLFVDFAKSCSSGTTNRQRMDMDKFLTLEIPLPSISEQEAIVKNYYSKIEQAVTWEQEADTIEKSIETYLFEELGIRKETEERTRKKGLQLVEFHKMEFWGVDKIKLDEGILSLQYEVTSIGDFPGLLVTCFRGKSPRYTETSSKFILNQKCNRWNSIDFSFVKSVDEDWYNNIDENIFTKEGDILVNSTGEGTIGRATYITKDYEELIYDSHILLLRLNRTVYNPILFVELFNSSYIQTQIDKIKSAQATKQTELGISNLLKIRIPILHNLQKQQTIIDQIDTYKNEIKVLREKATLLKQQAEQEFEQTIFS